jgi:hypothetical protein
MDNMLISVKKYAELCGVTFQAIIQRERNGHIEFTQGEKRNILGNPVKMVDIEKYPPVKAMRRGLKE